MSSTHLKEDTVMDHTQVAVLESGAEYSVSVRTGWWLKREEIQLNHFRIFQSIATILMDANMFARIFKFAK